MTSLIKDRLWWCEKLGLSVWGIIDEKMISEAARRALLSVHPDKGNRAEGAGFEIREILRAKEAGKIHVKISERLAEKCARSYETMDWEPISS
jgi:hypothetical protein